MFYCAGETNYIVIRQYLGDPISDYDNQVYLWTMHCNVLFLFFVLVCFKNLQNLVFAVCILMHKCSISLIKL